MPLATIGLIIFLGGLFFILGRAADVVVYAARRIGEALRVRVFFLGLMLGLLTSLPEIAVGFNAIINDLASITFGNLIGGIIVLLSLILGVSIVLNRRIATDGNPRYILAIVAYAYLPIILAFDGHIGFIDGSICVVLYAVLVWYLYLKSATSKRAGTMLDDMLDRPKISKELLWLVGGSLAVMIVSTIIIHVTTKLLEAVGIPQLLLGVVLFAIGTNLPELIVTIRSWRRKVRDLSLGNLIGSALANVLIVGILGLLKPYSIMVDQSYFILVFMGFIILGLVALFYISHSKLSRTEGFILAGLYVVFVITQFSAFALA